MEKEKGLEIKSMHIRYVFTEDEKREIATELALKFSEKEALELQKKEVSSKITSEINTANAAATRLSKEYNQGYTYKNHDCYEVFDYDEKSVYTYRADTEEKVSTRTMSISEYQKDLFNPTEKITEGEPLFDEDPEHSEAVQMAIRMKKQYPAQFTQACAELEFQKDPEKFMDVIAIAACEKIREILDSEDIMPDENPEDLDNA